MTRLRTMHHALALRAERSRRRDAGSEQGAIMAEYGLLIVLVALVAIVAVGVFGIAVLDLFGDTKEQYPESTEAAG